MSAPVFRVTLEATLTEDQCIDLDNLLDDGSIAPTRYEVRKVEPQAPVEGSPAFNPHGNRTSDGVLITVGLKVRDYNRNVSTVVADRDVKDWKCCAPLAHDHATPEEWCFTEETDTRLCTHHRKNDLVPDMNRPCDPGCSHDHWFDLENGAMMNGSRLESVR